MKHSNKSMNIEGVIKRMGRGTLSFHPEYTPWDEATKVQFILACLEGFPFPTVIGFLHSNDDIVLSTGQNGILTLADFIHNKFLINQEGVEPNFFGELCTMLQYRLLELNIPLWLCQDFDPEKVAYTVRTAETFF